MQTASKFGGRSPFFHHGILELFVFFTQLLRDGLEALPNHGFVFFVGVFYHIILIRADDVALNLQDLIQALGIYKCLYGVRHTAHNCILQKQFPHTLVQGIRYRGTALHTLAQKLYDRLGNAIGPKKFFKIQRSHIQNRFISNRHGLGLFFTIALDPQQTAGANHIIAAIQLKKFQSCPCIRADNSMVIWSTSSEPENTETNCGFSKKFR